MLARVILAATPGALDGGDGHSEAVRKLISNKSISYKSLKVRQETDYPVSPFLALLRIRPKVFSYKGFVSRQTLSCHIVSLSPRIRRCSRRAAALLVLSGFKPLSVATAAELYR